MSSICRIDLLITNEDSTIYHSKKSAPEKLHVKCRKTLLLSHFKDLPEAQNSAKIRNGYEYESERDSIILQKSVNIFWFDSALSDKDQIAPRGYKSVRPAIPGTRDYEPIILKGGSHFLLEDIPQEYACEVLKFYESFSAWYLK